MHKNKAVFEIKKDERLYQFLCDQNSPLGELYDVLCSMKAYVFQIIQAQQEEKKKEQTDECKAG